jgi:uncharacterized membrane protein YhdT
MVNDCFVAFEKADEKGLVFDFPSWFSLSLLGGTDA